MLNETKTGKAPGMDGVRVEMLKEGGVTVVEWLVRVFNICFMLSIVPVYSLGHYMCSATLQR